MTKIFTITPNLKQHLDFNTQDHRRFNAKFYCGDGYDYNTVLLISNNTKDIELFTSYITVHNIGTLTIYAKY